MASSSASAAGRWAFAATNAALKAPTLVPTTIDGLSPRRSSSGMSTDRTPTSYAPRAPPPDMTRATLTKWRRPHPWQEPSVRSRRGRRSLGRPLVEHRSQPHDRRALLHRYLEVLRRAHRQLAQPMLGSQLRQRREVRAALLRALGERRHRHQARDRDGAARDEVAELARLDA